MDGSRHGRERWLDGHTGAALGLVTGIVLGSLALNLAGTPERRSALVQGAWGEARAAVAVAAGSASISAR